MFNFSVGPPGDSAFRSPSYKRTLSNITNKENIIVAPVNGHAIKDNCEESPLKKMTMSPDSVHKKIEMPPSSPYHLAKHGRIQLICGPMFSGKSTELLRKMKVFEVALHKSLIVKYAKDDRFSDECLSTHDRVMRKAVQATRLSQIEEEAREFTIIGIDEGQFFEDVVPFSVEMANRGKIVIIAALDGTFDQKPFANIIELIPNCESIVKLTSVCMSCLKQAAFTRRLNSDTRVEVIGHEDLYAASCRRCLLLPQDVFKKQIEIRSELKRSQSQESLEGITHSPSLTEQVQRKLDF